MCKPYQDSKTINTVHATVNAIRRINAAMAAASDLQVDRFARCHLP